MKVAVLFECSGVVREAFRKYGHEAVSFDLLPSEQPGPHVQGDVLVQPEDYWAQFDLAICHPECTFLTNAGAKHLYTGCKKENGINQDRWTKMLLGVEMFRWALRLPVKHRAVENPIMHCHARERVGRQSQVIQPWMFGHPEKKATCLWLKGLPKLVPTDNVFETMQTLPKEITDRVHRMPPGPNRWMERSRTYAGIAEAMAQQWGSHVMQSVAAEAA